jgi:hypothetical protein
MPGLRRKKETREQIGNQEKLIKMKNVKAVHM